MTEKELLYVEDALNHLHELKMKFSKFENEINDEKVLTFIECLLKREEQMIQQFYNLL